MTSAGDDGLDVRGGARGAGARLEDLERCAAVTSISTEALWAVVDDLARVRVPVAAGPPWPPGQWSPLSLAAACGPAVQDLLVREADNRLGEIGWGVRGLAGSARRLDELHRKVAWTARAYLAADRGVSAFLGSMTWTTGFLAGRLGAALTPVPFGVPGLSAVAAAVPAPIASAWVSTLMLGAATLTGRPGLVQVAAGALPGVVSATTASRPTNVSELAAAAVLWSRLTPWLRESSAGALAAAGTWGASAGTSSRPASSGTVATVVAALAAAESGERAILVQRITAPDGRRAWLVAVPGVQTWDPVAGKNPYDVTGAVNAMAGGRPAVAVQVAGALRASGVRPGEPVLLAGHSMGGMVVAGLAADPSFRRSYRVTHLVTAGSPVAGFAVPRQVRVLSLEHVEDAVPALDGGDNPDRARWVTVRASGKQALSPGSAPEGGFGGHDLAAYRRTAVRLDAAGPQLLDGWSQGLEAFTEPGSEVRSQRFRASR